MHCPIHEEKGEQLSCLRTLPAPCRGQQDYLLCHGEHSSNNKRFYALYLFSTEVLRPELHKKQGISPDGPVKVLYSAFPCPLFNWISLGFDWNMNVGYLLSSVLYRDTESFL